MIHTVYFSLAETDISFLQISAFVRLSEARMIGDITEIPVPTRFVFFHLGPKDSEDKCIEIGRSMSTLMVDEVW